MSQKRDLPPTEQEIMEAMETLQKMIEGGFFSQRVALMAEQIVETAREHGIQEDETK